MKRLLPTIILPALLLTVLSSGACAKKEPVRKLPDSVPPVTASALPSAPRTQVKFDKPAGWSDKGGSTIRLATLVIDAAPNDAECTIISLQGEAGGLKPNVQRWLNQIDCEFDENKLDDFLAKQARAQTAGGLPVVLVDLTPFKPRTATSDISIMVGGISNNDSTIFVKFSGKKELLRKNKDMFSALCKSVRPE
jgi:hypothetical protein